MKKWLVLTGILIACVAFTTAVEIVKKNDRPVKIPASPQRLGGDAETGYTYLTTGDYVKGGIPYSLFVLGMGKDRTNYLHRSGKNARISYDYTTVKAANGELLVAPNCLQCHAAVFNDSLVIGLGNSFIDFTDNKKLNLKNLKWLESFLRITSPGKYRAAEPFIQVAKTVGPYLVADAPGVNAADRLAAVLAAHRDPVTFRWDTAARLDIPSRLIPTDTPPWWLLKKKHAMFYNGFGRGDFGRFLMASNLLTVNDTSESREVDSHMPDVLAYIYSLKPPKYPYHIDTALAVEGESVFNDKCAKCHGTYGDGDTYPNLLIPESIIQTDSFLYKANYSNPQFVDWFNRSWFTMGDHPARLEPYNGYIAPPLDGIWITAPYLHNGSVPNLEALLNSSLRPRYWSRDFQKPQFDSLQVGWQYAAHDSADSREVYNTTLPGYGNYGHYFGDRLSEKDRKAVIEYLKTL